MSTSHKAPAKMSPPGVAASFEAGMVTEGRGPASV